VIYTNAVKLRMSSGGVNVDAGVGTPITTTNSTGWLASNAGERRSGATVGHTPLARGGLNRIIDESKLVFCERHRRSRAAAEAGGGLVKAIRLNGGGAQYVGFGA